MVWVHIILAMLVINLAGDIILIRVKNRLEKVERELLIETQKQNNMLTDLLQLRIKGDAD